MAAIDVALAERLLGELDTDLQRDGRLGKVRRYLAGDHDLPYMPRGARQEFQHLAKRSITNWTPTVPGTFARSLFVDGYRPARAADNATPWEYWQANGLDARQSIVHRGALDYGTSYLLVLPGTLRTKRIPLMRPLSPLKSLAWYTDEDDSYPEIGLYERGTTLDGARLWEIYDREAVYTFAQVDEDGSRRTYLSSVDEHGLGVTPFVRFRDRLDGEAVGLVRPIMTLQDRANEVVFSTLIALQYASFRQRWATGLAIPEDEDGNPVEPFEAAVDRLWVSDDPDAKFGDFAQTELSGHLALYKQTIQTLAAVSDIHPGILMGDFDNPPSAEALAALHDATQRRLDEFETNFGESWEDGFRLAAHAAGDAANAADELAQVRWRDTEARSLAQTVDGLGKMAQMLAIPVEALWERVPGVTDADLTYWKSLREQDDPMRTLMEEVMRQSQEPGATPPPAAPGAEQ